MYHIFVELDRALLSIQDLNASVERLFGDRGYQEDRRRQNEDDRLTEMLLTVLSHRKY